jgi:hypothetical protein
VFGHPRVIEDRRHVIIADSYLGQRDHRGPVCAPSHEL